MNDTNRNHYDDEIDLFEIVEILWQSKWIIIAAVFTALIAASLYLMNKEVVYEYNLPYSYITKPDDVLFNHFLTLSNVPFSLNTKSKTLSLTSTNPNYEAAINSEAAIIRNKLTQQKSTSLIKEANLTIKWMKYKSQSLINEANLTIKLIGKDIPVQILNSETAAERYFEAKSVLQNITDGAEDNPVQILNSEVEAKRYFEAKSVLQNITGIASVIKFQPVVKTAKSSKTSLVLALSVIGGGMMGLFLVFMLRMIAAYKKRQVAP
jgi:LPS O-antigen subunit length determinant protein (WzzB/FepE family)